MHNMPMTYFIYTQTANQPGNHFLGALYEKTEKVVFAKVAFSNSISQLNLDWTSTLCGCQKNIGWANSADRDGGQIMPTTLACPPQIFYLPLPLISVFKNGYTIREHM